MTTQVPVQNGLAVVGKSHKARVEYLTRSRKIIVANLLVQYKKTEEQQKKAIIEAREPELDNFLAFLESPALAMTPALKDDGKVDITLNAVVNPSMKVPDRFVKRGKALLEKFQEDNWGGDAVTDEEDDDMEGQEATGEASTSAASAGPSKASTKKTSATAAATSVRYPARDHPIFGENGIMHGVLVKKGEKTKTYFLSDRYQARDSKVCGHNGLTVGAWFPYQSVALFNGAHGARVAGISGSSSLGAYSVVVSGAYEGLDRDEGDVIYYSGSGTNSHTNPLSPPKPSDGTMALRTSLDTGNPVRVLRSSKGKSLYKPENGLRYDGLYRVIGRATGFNKLGGMVELFKLVREEGQPSLESLAASSPTVQQKLDFHKISDGY